MSKSKKLSTQKKILLIKKYQINIRFLTKKESPKQHEILAQESIGDTLSDIEKVSAIQYLQYFGIRY